MREVVADRERMRGVLHDLACPLTIIRAACFELEREENDPDRRERLRVIDDQAGRLGAGLAALRQDVAPRPPELLSLADLVAGAVARLAPLARAEGKLLTGSMAADATIRGDAPRLDRAIDNLAINALRHCRRRVAISLAGGSRSDRVAVLVGDDGPGVAPRERDRIFRSGYRGERASGRGLGLGLSIASDVAAEHGGALRLRPSPTGALFSLDLPVVVDGRMPGDAA